MVDSPPSPDGGRGQASREAWIYVPVSRRGRNLDNYNGIDALTATRSAIVKNNPGLEKEIIPGLLQDLDLSFFLGQNQSPLAGEATGQAQYWARRHGKLEGLRTRLERSLGLGR